MPRIFITLILLFGIFILVFFYLLPAWGSFNDLQQGNQDLQKFSEEFDELIQNRDNLIKTINTLSKDDLNSLDEALPQGAKAAEFLVALDNLAKKNNISIKRVDVPNIEVKGGNQTKTSGDSTSNKGIPRPGVTTITQAPQKLGSVGELPLSLGVSGVYESFKQFLWELEKNLRVVNVSELSFNAPADSNKPIDFSLKLTTYYQTGQALGAQ